MVHVAPVPAPRAAFAVVLGLEVYIVPQAEAQYVVKGTRIAYEWIVHGVQVAGVLYFVKRQRRI